MNVCEWIHIPICPCRILTTEDVVFEPEEATALPAEMEVLVEREKTQSPEPLLIPPAPPSPEERREREEEVSTEHALLGRFSVIRRPTWVADPSFYVP